MGDKKFTFVELHLDGDTQFGPKTITDALPIGDVETEEESIETVDDEAAAATEEESGGKGAVGVVLALVVLVGIAVAVRKFRGGEDEEFEEREEPDVVVN